MSPKRPAQLAIGMPLYLLAVLPERGLRWSLGRARDKERDRRKTDPRGSEMHVCLARGSVVEVDTLGT
jgi:hypothetical protein